MRWAFFPLDEELHLAAGQQFTPLICESMVHLGSAMPFKQAVESLQHFCSLQVSSSTIRRMTEQVGSAYEALEESRRLAGVESASPPMEVQLVTVDGAFVPLVGGEWKEVKTLTIGEVSGAAEETSGASSNLSYFSRLSEVNRWSEQAQVEVQRRGTARARTVLSVSDGAIWIQRVVDKWRADAVRILDLPHALGYVARAGQALHGVDTPAFTQWYNKQYTTLLEGRPQQVVDALQQLSLQADDLNLPETAQTTIHEGWGYLHKRLSMMHYAAFRALGYPIASGAGESANKLVVERRLKGPGMRWREANVNALLALTNLKSNHRWTTDWPHIMAFRLQQARAKRLARRPGAAAEEPVVSEALPAEEPPPAKASYRPAADHPWRRSFNKQSPASPGS